MNSLVKRLGVILFVLASPVFGFRCLAAGFPVSNSEISKLVPELTNPRIMQLSDLNSQQRAAFTDYGFSFWLRGDFNMDQRDDIVIAGHFDNIKNRDDQAFVLVLSKFGNHWRRQYFLRPKAPVVSLSYEDHPDDEKRKKGFRAFISNFSILPSDDFAIIFWDGSKYAASSGFRTP